jgi:hypothetical protein
MYRLLSSGCATAVLVMAMNLAPGRCGAQPPQPGKNFVVFDALLYQGKPQLSSYGMRPLMQVNQPDAASPVLDEAKTRERMAAFMGSTQGIFLDYEIWPLTGVPAPVIAGNIVKFNRVLEIARESAPQALIGYYGVLPCGEYWGIVRQDAKKLGAWKECNRQGEAIAPHVDAVFPSLYTYYNDQPNWDVYAKAVIQEARRYHKPVYVFLWPEFHVSNALLRGTNVPAPFWRHQLELCKSLADGIVIWGGWQEPWREDAAWWGETKGFLSSLNHH